MPAYKTPNGGDNNVFIDCCDRQRATAGDDAAQHLDRHHCEAGMTATTKRPQALTAAQTGLWFAQQLDPANPVFNVAHAIELTGSLNIDAFKQACATTLAEADSLALRMQQDATGPRQFIDSSLRPTLECIDLSEQTDPRTAAHQAMYAERMTPCDPTSDALACTRLYTLGAEHYLWYLRVHHLAIDGFGMTLLADRVAALYTAAINHKTTAPALTPLQAALDDDAAYSAAPQHHTDAHFWQQLFSDRPRVASLTTATANSAHHVHRIDDELPRATCERLQLFAHDHQQSWVDVLTCITALYVQRMAAAKETVIGVPQMARFGSPAARTPAMVMNVLPIRVGFDETQPLAILCDQLAATLSQCRQHGRYRSEQLRRDLGLLGGDKRLYGPLVNILPFQHSPRFAGITAIERVLATGPVDDITLTFRGNPRAHLSLEIEANPCLYSHAAALAHAARLKTFIDAVLDAGSSLPVPLASPAEVQRLLIDANATSHSLDDTNLAALIEARMQATPDACAVVFAGHSLSYAELDRRTAALAHALVERGIGCNDFVAVPMARSLELIIALVAVLRAGAANLPLDPTHPPERLRSLIRNTQARCVLLADPDVTRLTHIDNATSTTDNQPLDNACLLPVSAWPASGSYSNAASLAPDAAAYILYTSGSSGTPKGVVVEHAAIVNRLLWMRDHYQITPHDRILHKTPTTFDVSVWELFLPLISGAMLVIAEPDVHRDPRLLARLIDAQHITCMHFVPSMLAAFLAALDSTGGAAAANSADNITTHCPSLTRVYCSGEALGADLRARFHRHINAQLHNLYGPTEAAIDVSYWPASVNDTSRPLPIGFPVWNTRLYVLDDFDRPLPAGVSGHLLLAGAQLARGYLGLPEKTAQTFVADPFSAYFADTCTAPARMYRSGDLAYWRDDGAVVYQGRADSQVKIHGVRIEPSEIEAAILASTHVQDTCVMVREDRTHDPRLVAYVVPNPTGDYQESSLRHYLRTQLPDYMQPSLWITLEALPITANGKLDRRALPAPSIPVADNGRALTGATEKTLGQLFKSTLGLARLPTADADFFALGGDSLVAVQLVVAIEQQLAVEVGLGALFANPSIAGLAASIDTGNSTTQGLEPLIELAAGAVDAAPLFLVHPAGGISWCYLRLARALAPQRCIYGLQAPALDTAVPQARSIRLLATDYVQRLRTQQPHGPYCLAGWSMGGIIAHEIACQLQQQGCEVRLLAVLDAYPADCWRNQPAPDAAAALRALLAIAGYDPEHYTHLDSRAAIIDFLRADGSALGRLPAATLDGVVRVVAGTNRLVRAHYHHHFSGTLLHVRAARDHQNGELSPTDWHAYVDTIEVLDLDCHHADLTGETATQQIAPRLTQHLKATQHSEETTCN